MSQRARRHTPFSRLGELFNAGALGLLTLMLISLSFFATWRGMRDFVIGNDLAAGLASQGLVLAIVLTLTLAMYVALREVISPYYTPNWWAHVWKRLLAFPLYVLLAVWSVGFGYGFWWSVIAGQGVTNTELTQSVSVLREETSDVRSRIIAAGSVMASAEALSDQKAQNEAERGGTCGVASPPGDGPLARARSETQSQIATLSATVQGDWLTSITARLDTLERALQSARTMDGAAPAVRKAAFEEVYATARLSAREISTDAAARGRSLSTQLRAKADQLSVPPEGGRVAYCYDPDLAASLIAAANEIDQPFEIRVPEFRFSEGAEGVARAVEDLWGGLLARVGIVDAPVSGEPPSGRSLIALVATIGVDLALLVFALLQGRGGPAGPVDDGVIEGGAARVERAERKPVAKADRLEALPGPSSSSVKKTELLPRIPKPRQETRPAAVGIRTTPPESQISDAEQVDDLMRDVDEIYRTLTPEEKLAHKDAEIARLNAELNKLKQQGYIATGRPGQMFDPKLHEEVGAQASDAPPGTIIATVRPGYITDGLNVYRVAHVIVSSGRRKFDF